MLSGGMTGICESKELCGYCLVIVWLLSGNCVVIVWCQQSIR